jgi:hypothetical protein
MRRGNLEAQVRPAPSGEFDYPILVGIMLILAFFAEQTFLVTLR